MRAGIVGHVELVEFAPVDHLPAPGEIVHAGRPFREAAGGGGVAAVQMARMLGEATMLTALGDDEPGEEAACRLRELGVTLHAAKRAEPQRRAFTLLDAHGERTIVTLGERHAPSSNDATLPWAGLSSLDAVFVSAGDAGAIRAARAARVVVATPRAGPGLAQAGIELDALVASASDPGEQIDPGVLDPPPRVVVRTRGAQGGDWSTAEGATGTWDPMPAPGPPVDAFGCGDTFVAGLTVALGARLQLTEALRFAAGMAVICLTGRGPYGAPLPRAPF